MSAAEAPTLPGTPPPALQAAYALLSPLRQAALREHLLGGTGAAYLADWMTRAGAPVGETTIKLYRRRLRSEGSV